MADILVVDDEIGIRELLSEILGDEGHSVLLAENAQQARRVRDGNRLDLVLLDIWMPDTDGVTLLREWASAGTLTMPVIMMSGHATIDTAVEATRIGAFDFLEKPITMQKLLDAVESGLGRARALAATGSPAAAGLGGMLPADVVAAGGGIVTARIEIGGGVPGGTVFTTGAGSAVRPDAGAAGIGTGAPSALTPGAAPSAGHAATGAGTSGAASDIRPSGQAGAVRDRAPGAAETGAVAGVAAVAPGHVALHELPLELPLREARDRFERAYFEHHLIRERGSMTRVAERTGLERTHLYRKLKQLGIDLSRGTYRKQGGDSA